MGTIVEITASDGHLLSAYKAEPVGTPKAGVVVIQEIFGVNEHIRDVTDKFALEGFLTIAPALFDRVEPGVELGYGPDDRDKGIATRAGVELNDAVKDITAARKYISNAGKVGIVGFCYGGTIAWLGACKAGFNAASGYYGGGIHENLDLQSKCPIELHFGSEDQGIPMQNVDLIRAAKPDIGIYVYEDAGHGFMCDHRPSFDAEATKVASARTLKFFNKHLG
jgi:carboxymethylenebutenolidase